MAIQQISNVTILLNGDGSSTSFTYSFDQFFELINGDGGQFLNFGTLPSSVLMTNASAPIPGGGSASLDGFGNIVFTFPSSWTGIGQVYLQLNFNSGTLAGTTAAWTSATTINTTWTLPLNGNTAVQVGFVVSGTLTGGTIVFEVSQDGSNWFPIQGSISSGYTALTGWTPGVGSLPISVDVAGFAYFRNRLSSILVGSGTVTFIIQGDQSTNEPVPTVGQANGANLHVTLDDAAGGNAANTTAKGTQAARALGVQELKDAGRNPITFYVDQLTGVTSEALMTLQRVVGLVAGTASTSYTVTAGKTLRLQSMAVTVRDTTTTLATARIRVRGVPSGSVAANSPIVALVELPNLPGTAAAGVGTVEQFDFPDGIEIPGGAQIGISHIESSTSSTISVCLIGYEY